MSLAMAGRGDGGPCLLKIKADCAGEKRRFSVLGGAGAWARVRGRLGELYGLSSFAVAFVDEEGDEVVVGSDRELQDALADRGGDHLLRLLVSPASGGSGCARARGRDGQQCDLAHRRYEVEGREGVGNAMPASVFGVLSVVAGWLVPCARPTAQDTPLLSALVASFVEALQDDSNMRYDLWALLEVVKPHVGVLQSLASEPDFAQETHLMLLQFPHYPSVHALGVLVDNFIALLQSTPSLPPALVPALRACCRDRGTSPGDADCDSSAGPLSLSPSLLPEVPGSVRCDGPNHPLPRESEHGDASFFADHDGSEGQVSVEGEGEGEGEGIERSPSVVPAASPRLVAVPSGTAHNTEVRAGSMQLLSWKVRNTGSAECKRVALVPVGENIFGLQTGHDGCAVVHGFSLSPGEEVPMSVLLTPPSVCSSHPQKLTAQFQPYDSINRVNLGDVWSVSLTVSPDRNALEEQLTKQLAEMGFTDRAKVLAMLRDNNHDANLVAAMLLSNEQ